MKAFFYIEFVSFCLLAICLLCFCFLGVLHIRAKKVKLEIKPKDKKTKFAVIIPARYESKVIDTNLNALYNANYPKEFLDIYVIVESMNDPTVELCKKYERVKIFLRTNLENEGKGHALDECINDIFANNDIYDAFLILDADNVITPEFLNKMSDAYQAGYDAACGKRNNKDWNSSWVSSSSCLTFTAINSIQNKKKTAMGLSVTFTGTGFFVSCNVLRKLGGWKFFSLTEDYEFSTFVMCNGIKNCYVEDAVFYDEQPKSLRQSIIQRTRWIKGYFSVRIGYRKMKKEFSKNNPKNNNILMMRLGSLPALAAVIDIIAYLVFSVAGLVFSVVFGNGYAVYFLLRIGIVLGLIYLIMMIATVVLLKIEGDKIKITFRNKVKTVLLHPFFLITYVVSALRALFTKSKWEVIEHSITEAIEV